jgi:hypothetical protein
MSVHPEELVKPCRDDALLPSGSDLCGSCHKELAQTRVLIPGHPTTCLTCYMRSDTQFPSVTIQALVHNTWVTIPTKSRTTKVSTDGQNPH